MGPVLQDGTGRAIDLTNATSLCNITAIAYAENLVEDISIFLTEILLSLPDSTSLVVIRPYADENAQSGDDTVVDRDHEGIGTAWAAAFAYDEFLPFEGIRVPCDVLTLRLLHPLRWDEHLDRGVNALRNAGIPLRLEYLAGSGAICFYGPSHE